MSVRGLFFFIAAAVFAVGVVRGATTPSDAGNDPNVLALIKWVKSKGGWFKGVAVATSSRGYRGVVAKRDLKAGEVITRTPFTTLINIEHALAHPTLGPVISDEMDDASDTTIMGAFIAWLKATGDSEWSAYVKVLPEELNTPVYYPPHLLDELKGSSLLSFIIKRHSASDLNYEKLSRTFTERISPTQFLWGLSILWSRTFGVKVKDPKGVWQKAPCFVPLADMFNTGSSLTQLNTDCRTTPDSRYFECFTTKAVAAGGELLVPYGHELGNQQLLLDYGVVHVNNTKTAVTLVPAMMSFPDTTNLNEDEHVNDFQARVLEHFKFADAQKMFFSVTAPVTTAIKFGDPLPLPLPLLLYVRVKCLDLNTLNGFKGGKATQQDVVNALRANEVFGLDHERVVVATITSALQKLLSAYPTPLAEDILRLNSEDNCLASYTSAECGMFRNILALRTEEKLILQRNIDMLKNYESGLFKKIAKATPTNRHVDREEL